MSKDQFKVQHWHIYCIWHHHICASCLMHWYCNPMHVFLASTQYMRRRWYICMLSTQSREYQRTEQRNIMHFFLVICSRFMIRSFVRTWLHFAHDRYIHSNSLKTSIPLSARVLKTRSIETTLGQEHIGRQKRRGNRSYCTPIPI